MLETTAPSAAWLLPFVAPICLWVIYTDLSTMKIRNVAVLALLGVYVVVGLFVMPSWSEYLWRYAHFAAILVAGFLLSLTGGFGAGDAKFMAAMAPLVAFGDAGKALMLLSLCMVLAFVLHRLARATPAIRRLAPDWASWEARKFPMGTALGSCLILYLALGAFAGASS